MVVIVLYISLPKNVLTFEVCSCCEFLIMVCLWPKHVDVPGRSLGTVYMLFQFVRYIYVCVG